MKVTITMEERQARLVLRCLDLMSRVGMGQLEIVEERLREWFWSERTAHVWPEVALSLRRVRRLVLTNDSAMSIRNPEVPADARECYDIQQVIEFELAKASGVSALRNVWLREYRAAHPEWPSVRVVVEDAPAQVAAQ